MLGGAGDLTLEEALDAPRDEVGNEMDGSLIVRFSSDVCEAWSGREASGPALGSDVAAVTRGGGAGSDQSSAVPPRGFVLVRHPAAVDWFDFGGDEDAREGRCRGEEP